MEVYSPPRLLPQTRALGLRGQISVDILTGWNFMQEEHRIKLLHEIQARRPRFVFLSDPCVFWSSLTELNWPFMTPVKREQLAWEGATHCDFSALISKIQIHGGRAYAKEHPAKAKSWDRPSVLGWRFMKM